MTSKTLKIKKLSPAAVTPTYGTPGAAGFDLYSTETNRVNAGGSQVFGTGLAVEVPPDHVMLVFSRSGDGFKHNVRLSNCVGVIDEDYRGEVKIKLANDGFYGVEVEQGQRIAQGVLTPVTHAVFEEVEELSPTYRGEDGFGSTGR